MVVGQFGSFIDGFLRNYDGEIEEGDVILLNDPYSVGGAISHNNDVLAIAPIYRGGRLVAWSAMFGHMTDVGGRVPGSLPTNAGSIFEEGLRLPPVKLYRRGANCRKISSRSRRTSRACRNGSRRICTPSLLRVPRGRKAGGGIVRAVWRRHGGGRDGGAAGAQPPRDGASDRDRVIGEAPVSFEDYVCDDGRGAGPFKHQAAQCGARVKKWCWILPARTRNPASSINFLLNENMFKMFFGIYMVMVFDPQIMFNDGFYDLVDVRIPGRESAEAAVPGRALSCRTHALGRIFDVLGALLGQKTPEFLCAAGFSSSPHLMFSGYRRGRQSGFSCFKSGLAASRGGRSGMARTGIRCGRALPTCRTNFWNAISRW